MTAGEIWPMKSVRGAMVLLAFALAAGCGGGEDSGAADEPLIEESPNVTQSGTGPGVVPAPPADSIPVGAASRGPGANVQGADSAQH